jgi:hypothetical protein
MRKTLFLILITVFFTIGSCASQNNVTTAPQKELVGSFGIYLVKGDFGPYLSKIPAIDNPNLILDDKPIISIDDIVYYKKNSHEIELTPSAFARIKQFGIRAPLIGPLFAVCLDRKPIYLGAFVSPLSSISFNGVTIDEVELFSPDKNIIHLYGWEEQGQDPRSNPLIFRSLEKAGKLK